MSKVLRPNFQSKTFSSDRARTRWVVWRNLCYGLVVDAIPPRHISRSFDKFKHGGPYLLPELPHISADIGDDELSRPTQFAWYDPIEDIGSVGTIHLTQHVLGIRKWRDAAWRIAMFAEPSGDALTIINHRFFADPNKVMDEILGKDWDKECAPRAFILGGR